MNEGLGSNKIAIALGLFSACVPLQVLVLPIDTPVQNADDHSAAVAGVAPEPILVPAKPEERRCVHDEEAPACHRVACEGSLAASPSLRLCERSAWYARTRRSSSVFSRSNGAARG